ncbi:hypothetical protein BGW36DRAFT_408487 [Talaromyces proteolyticus]|uniref:Uncharacterized protein n=1 Tax=Talaromyces proteolyticus TaxID=1131652 RepID=A0AAD4KQH9_9EURO|nr:uncharacterized protein BGW36DRAFT_408487 [Talaromyces proteolyticus]KAH8696678.1 hypothetical protein BGW36DRAFT_408487 [Talaromyces proteolyticus]
MSKGNAKYDHPPYTPMPSLGHELGIMFGFLAACVLTVGVYYIFWQASQQRAAARDDARRKDLRARGFHHERGGYHDKALGRYASRDPVAQTQGQTLQFLTEPGQLDGNHKLAGPGVDSVAHEAIILRAETCSSRGGRVDASSSPSFEGQEMQTFSTDGEASSRSLSAVHMHRARDLF